MLMTQKIMKNQIKSFDKMPTVVSNSLVTLGSKVVHENEITAFLDLHKENKGMDFIDAVLEYFSIEISLKQNEIENIPSEGKAIIVANHPLGMLDALALIKLVSMVRSDIKILANNLLSQFFDNLEEFLVPIDIMQKRVYKTQMQGMLDALANEELVILFPAGEVSRTSLTGVKDKEWKKGFLSLAKKTIAPIIPIHIKAKNSLLFYSASLLKNSLGTMLLPHEMIRSTNKKIAFSVGNAVEYKSVKALSEDVKEQCKLFKKHIYSLKKGKNPIFETMCTIAHPENLKYIRKELKECKKLGMTPDGKIIYLYKYHKDSRLLKELGRLREISFRRVGEGSGRKRDVDAFDKYYEHIILWSEEELEIVGSYRIANVEKVVEQYGVNGLYTSQIFDYKKPFERYLENSIELGRSFVQPKYWGSHALDYLWQGIGAYLKHNPNIETMFGAVSLSGNNTKEMNSLIISFYDMYFNTSKVKMVKALNPFKPQVKEKMYAMKLFNKDYKEDFKTLKTVLAKQGYTIPTLYKQYADVCDTGGVQFLDYCFDKEFNSIDSFIVVDVKRLKEKKRKRYIDSIIVE